MKINKIWHTAHKMVKNPSLEKRLAWHVAHSKYCNCRPMPKNLFELASKKN